MSSEQHRTAAHSDKDDIDHLTQVPSELVTRQRAAKKWQLIIAGFVAVACLIIGVRFFG